MQTIWIDKASQLQSFCEQIGDGPLAVDTESDHFHAYRPKVCLIQIATRELAALVDPLALDAEALAPLFAALADPKLNKIFHSANSDINELNRDYGLTVANIFDTQVASRFLNYERNGLSWLLEELLGVVPGKQFQRFDWTRRPIPADAQEYAAGDVIHLFDLQDRFAGELDGLGWSQAFEEQCAYMAATSDYTANAFDPERWRRIKTRHVLNGRERAALREVFIWRHELCSQLNRAGLFVYDNSSLVRVAQARPRTPEELAALPIRETLSKTQTRGLLDAIERSLSAPVPPERPPRVDHEKMAPRAQAALRALKEWRDATAGELGLPFEFLATNATLTDLALMAPPSVEGLADFTSLLPWVRTRFGQKIVALASGK